MRRCLSLSFAILSFAVFADVTVPYPGPRLNPDDQARFCWDINKHGYPHAVAAGFNTFITLMGSTWYTEPPERRAEILAKRIAFLKRMEADGVDVLDQVKMHVNKKIKAEYCRLNRDGSKRKNFDYMRPDAQAKMREELTALADALKVSTALVGVQTSSEVRDGARPSWSPESQAACRKALGFNMLPDAGKTAPHYSRIAGFPVSRLVPDDDKYLRYCLWYWKEGDAWNRYQDDVAALYNERFGRPIFSMYDPIVRTPPVWGSGGHDSVGSQWVYCNPQPCAPSFVISEQQAMARGMPGQKVWIMPQGITYRVRAAPIEKKQPADVPQWAKEFPKAKYITTPPDILQEGYWAIFSRQTDGFGAYACKAFFRKPGDDPKTVTGYACTNPRAFLTVSNLCVSVAVPLGPLFKAVPERKPEVAILESCAQCFFASRTSFGWGYVWGDFATLANLQPYALWEEEIARDGIPSSLKVLLMPNCEVLTEKTFKAIRDFQNRGGIVVSDENLVPGLMPDLQLPTGLLSHVARAKCPSKDTKLLRRAAKELRTNLAWAYRPYGDSDNPDIFVHVRSWKDADYLFAINDNRAFGDYVGPWKILPEKGQPSKGTVTIRRAAKAVYDLVRHQAVPFTVTDGVTEIPVSYETNDGRLFLAVSRPLGKLSVSVSGGEVTVTSPDTDAMIPIEICRKGEKPFYGVIRDGKWRHTFPVAPASVRVRNLADGLPVEWIRE